jgi:hypothetical protein
MGQGQGANVGMIAQQVARLVTATLAAVVVLVLFVAHDVLWRLP